MGIWDDIEPIITNDLYNSWIVTGLLNTLKITIMALIIGLLLGILVSVVRTLHDKGNSNIIIFVLNAICRVYVSIIRGTPMVVQLMIIYFVVFRTFQADVIVAAIAFGINSGAYVSEIVRAGIDAVPRGQFEACHSLGMPFFTMMSAVILPQAVRNILPALCNEGIALLKETSISGYIGILDLTRAGDLIRGKTMSMYVPLIEIALIYLAMVMILTFLVGRLERRLRVNAV